MSETCKIVGCTRSHITFTCGIHIIDLRNPQEDTHTLVLNTINEKTRGQELQNAKTDVPIFEQLSFEFKNITQSKRDELFTFLKNTAGLEVTLVDGCNKTWVGVILDDEIKSTNYAAGKTCGNGLIYSVSLKFEGTLQ